MALATSQQAGTTSGAINLGAPGGWAQAVLVSIGAPSDPSTPAGARNIGFLEAWRRAEGTKAAYNPLATTLTMPGSADFNTTGVQSYANPNDGIAATSKTLLAGYPHVVSSLRAGDPGGITDTAGGRADLNRWVSGQSSTASTQYVNNIRTLFYGIFGEGKSAADWTSFDAGDAANAAAAAAGKIPGVGALAGIAQDFSRVVGALLSANTWRRAGLALLGVIMMVAGGLILARGAGGGSLSAQAAGLAMRAG